MIDHPGRINIAEFPTVFAAFGASNAFQIQDRLPKDRRKLLAFLDDIIKNAGENSCSVIPRVSSICNMKIEQMTWFQNEYHLVH